MLLADAAPMGWAGAVLQATSAPAVVRARASGMNRKLVMTDSWMGLGKLGGKGEGRLDKIGTRSQVVTSPDQPSV